MAEIVGLHVECMIPELEQMKRLKLFKQEEISDIIKKRKEYEYKIERTSKEKQDFLRYIGYEVKLLREIKLRRDKYHISERKNEIEYAVAKRVLKLYKLVLSYFKSDVKIWMSYINFCTQTRFSNAVSEAFKQMLQVHGDKKHLWKFAAKWELEESNNVEGALNYLHSGLVHHPDSRELYTEAFKLELLAGSQKSLGAFMSENKEDREGRLQKALLRASVVFKKSIETIKDDVEFVISLLEIATEYDFTEKLQYEIMEHLTKNCWKSELMWHTMAQRELQGLHYDKNDQPKSRIQLCISVYKTAVQVVPTSAMWEKYLDTLIDIYTDKSKKKNFKRDILEAGLQDAYAAGFLSEKHYLMWVEISRDDPSAQLEILVKATASIPCSEELWLTRLHYHITRSQDEQIVAVSDEAIKALGKKALRIYQTLILFYQTKQNGSVEVKRIFDKGIAQDPEISLPLRPQYIEWLNLQKNIKIARLEYEKLAELLPYCLELHRKMINLERARFSLCVPTMRHVYKLACEQFGKERTDVWMDHITFESQNGDPRLISDIYNTAKNTLNEELVNSFCSDFAVLNATLGT